MPSAAQARPRTKGLFVHIFFFLTDLHAILVHQNLLAGFVVQVSHSFILSLSLARSLGLGASVRPRAALDFVAGRRCKHAHPPGGPRHRLSHAGIRTPQGGNSLLLLFFPFVNGEVRFVRCRQLALPSAQRGSRSTVPRCLNFPSMFFVFSSFLFQFSLIFLSAPTITLASFMHFFFFH